jgi:hypothetical protein
MQITKKNNKLSDLSLPGIDKYVDIEAPSILKISNNLSKKKIEHERLEAEYKNMLKPSECSNDRQRNEVKKKRNDMRNKIRRHKLELENMTKKSKELIIDDEVDRLNALAKRVNNPVKDFNKFDPLEFEKEKQNLIYRAVKFNDNKSEFLAKAIITAGGICEAFPYCQGVKAEMKKNKADIKDACNALLIDMGMSGTDLTKYINPYYALLLASTAPILTIAINNYANDTKKKILSEKKKQEKKILIKPNQQNVEIIKK